MNVDSIMRCLCNSDRIDIWMDVDVQTPTQ